jgi:hypothetical protein
MKLSSDLCAGISLFGILLAGCFGLVGMMLVFSSHSLSKSLMLFVAAPAFLLGIIIFVAFYRESKRIRQVEAEEELIRKLAIEKLEKEKLGN